MSTKGAHNLQNKEIMKREQIIKIMQKGFEEMACREASKSELNYFKESADAILTLSLDVPDSDFLLDILLKVNEYIRQENQFIATEYVGVFKEWMRDEIIKRNK